MDSDQEVHNPADIGTEASNRGFKSLQLPAVLTFIDFKKAFDSVHRGKDSRSLRHFSQNRRAYAAHVREDNGQSPKSSRRNEIIRDTSRYVTGRYHSTLPLCNIHRLLYEARAIGDDAERIGLTLERRKSRRVGPNIITDVDFADDIAFISDDVDKANEFLLQVESAAASVGLHINEGKIKVMTLNMKD